MYEYVLRVNKINKIHIYVDFQLCRKRIDWKSIHNHYSHIFMKCNMHKCIQRHVKIYAEGTRWSTGTISLVQIHRQHMGKKHPLLYVELQSLVVFLFWGWGKGGAFPFCFYYCFEHRLNPISHMGQAGPPPMTWWQAAMHSSRNICLTAGWTLWVPLMYHYSNYTDTCATNSN